MRRSDEPIQLNSLSHHHKTECDDTLPGNEGLATENTPPADLERSVLAIGRTSIPKNSIDLQDRINSWVDKDLETK